LKLLVSALEHSANIHLKRLHKELDGVEFVGIFDQELGESIVDLRSLAIMGFVDALKKLRFFFKLADTMVELAKDVDKVLLMDSSGFNLPLAKKLKKAYPQKEIIYYILPQAWAWKPKRIPVLERTCNHLASILPFEKEYYSKDAPITYVGHPLLDLIPHFKQTLNEEVKEVVFMPGSRRSEISKLMPVFHEVRKKLGTTVQATIVIPQFFTKEEREKLYGDLGDYVVEHDTYEVLYRADFAFICSGTATLEASLIGIPFVLAYIAKKLDYFIASRLVKLNYLGLANILLEKKNNTFIHPEFIQDTVTPQNLLEAYYNFNKENFLKQSKELREYLAHGSAKNVAKIILEQ
jgi:lipid-A-disaccharide synthase